MVEQGEFLIAVAGLAIALIAFSTIVVALRQMSGGGLGDFQVLVVKLFTLCGFCAVFYSLLPLLLSYFGIHAAWIWRVSNVALAGSAIGIHIWYFRGRAKVAPGRPLNLTNYINIVSLVVAVSLLMLSTFELALPGSFGPYAFALVALLVAAATAFLRTLPDFLARVEDQSK